MAGVTIRERIKKALGIRSPSRQMQELNQRAGEWMKQGIAEMTDRIVVEIVSDEGGDISVENRGTRPQEQTASSTAGVEGG